MHPHPPLDRHPRRPPDLDEAISALDAYLDGLEPCDRARALHWLRVELDHRHHLELDRLTHHHPANPTTVSTGRAR